MVAENQNPKQEIPDIVKGYLEMAIPPEGMGNDYFVFNWSFVMIFVPYAIYLLNFINKHYILWILLAFSIAMIILYSSMVEGFKNAMFNKSNSHDFILIEFINLANIIVFYGLSYYYLSKLYPNQFNNTGTALDFIYYSIVTMATIGYGDIVPIQPAAKIIAISQIMVSIWFFVTVIPIAVADQAERMKLWRIRQEKFARILKEKIESGELPPPEPIEYPKPTRSMFKFFKKKGKPKI